MRDLHMVDLKSQYEHIQEEVDRAVGKVIQTAQFINGPEVKAFQSELDSIRTDQIQFDPIRTEALLVKRCVFFP